MPLRSFLDERIALVGALEDRKTVGFGISDTSAEAINEVEGVVGRWRITRTIGKEVVQRFQSFWPICVGSYQGAMLRSRDMREHVGKVDNATNT